jgi:hypothetical protein
MYCHCIDNPQTDKRKEDHPNCNHPDPKRARVDGEVSVQPGGTSPRTLTHPRYPAKVRTASLRISNSALSIIVVHHREVRAKAVGVAEGQELGGPYSLRRLTMSLFAAGA